MCIPPIHLPYGELASESKAGVLKIISSSRAVSSMNSIARHTDQVLTKLYRKTIQREMDHALRDPGDQGSPLLPVKHDSVGNAPPSYANGSRTLRRRPPEATSNSPVMPEMDDTATASFVNGEYSIGPDNSPLPVTLPGGPDSSTAPVVSYLQFRPQQPFETTGTFLTEHLDEAFGIFDQSKSAILQLPIPPKVLEHSDRNLSVYEINFQGGTSNDLFGSERNF